MLAKQEKYTCIFLLLNNSTCSLNVVGGLIIGYDQTTISSFH